MVANLWILQQLETSEQDKIDLQRKLKAAHDGEAAAAQKVRLYLFFPRPLLSPLRRCNQCHEHELYSPVPLLTPR